MILKEISLAECEKNQWTLKKGRYIITVQYPITALVKVIGIYNTEKAKVPYDTEYEGKRFRINDFTRVGVTGLAIDFTIKDNPFPIVFVLMIVGLGVLGYVLNTVLKKIVQVITLGGAINVWTIIPLAICVTIIIILLTRTKK